MTEIKHHIVEEKTVGREFHVPIAPRTVYVVTYNSPYAEDDRSCEVIGVFSSHKRAEEAVADHAHTKSQHHEISEHRIG